MSDVLDATGPSEPAKITGMLIAFIRPALVAKPVAERKEVCAIPRAMTEASSPSFSI